MMVDELGLNSNFIKKYKEIINSCSFGNKLLSIEGISDDKLKPMNMLKNILSSDNIANASIDDSANVSSTTINTIKNEAIKPIWRIISHNKIYNELIDEYGLDFANEWIEDQVKGRYYLHNGVSASTLPYCYSFSLKLVAERGLFFIENMKGGRAKHLSTWVDHVAEFVNYASNQLSGAVAIPSMILWMFKFWKDDVDSGYISKENADRERDQAFQKFIFRINQPTVRDGIQSAYVNCQILDRPHLEAFFGDQTFVDGTYMIDYFDEFVEFQKNFLEYVNKLRFKFFYTYPVLTASLKVDENKNYEDEYVAKYVVKHNMTWQDTNIYNADDITSLSSCCRLVNSVEEINKGKEKIEGFFSSIGGTSISIGSMQVNTINFARIAYESDGDFNKYKELLIYRINFSHKVLYVIRKILEQLIEKNKLPIYNSGLIDKNRQFMTIGINSLYSSIKFMGGISENEIGEVEYNDMGKNMMEEIFKIINKENSKTLDLYGFTSNAEQIPAEGCGKILLFKDKLFFKNNITENTNIYENQWIPLTQKADFNSRIETCANYDPKCGGGAIGHFNIGEPIDNFEDAWSLATHIAKMGVIYYSLIHKFSYCEEEHSFYGETCPICGGKRKGYGIKIVGYIVKSENFHDLRKEELENRVFYDLTK